MASENGVIVSDLNKKVTELQNEVRSLKDLNARLSEDNKELRDLCCFLDDDRQKGRKLAREWQRFGRYTASVMRQEVSNYQTKLKDLAGKQEELIRDNLELKVSVRHLKISQIFFAFRILAAVLSRLQHYTHILAITAYHYTLQLSLDKAKRRSHASTLYFCFS